MNKQIRRTLFLLFLTVSCGQDKKSTPKYFDFDALIDTQVSWLSQSEYKLAKKAGMGNTSSDSTYLPSLAGSPIKGWNSELEVFRALETINRPTYGTVYQVEDPVEDPRSNLKIRQLTAQAVPVPVLKFYYQSEFNRLKKIEAETIEENLLFYTHRWLVMEFEEDKGKPALTNYAMTGFQKMFLSDTVWYSVAGRVER